MTPEEKFNQDVWWILQEIKKEQLAGLKTNLFESLRKAGVKVNMPGVDMLDPLARSALMNTWFIESRGGKKYNIQFLPSSEEELLDGEIEQASFSAYRFSDQFFGNLDRLNDILSEHGNNVETAIKRNVDFYRHLLGVAKKNAEERDIAPKTGTGSGFIVLEPVPILGARLRASARSDVSEETSEVLPSAALARCIPGPRKSTGA